MATTSCRETLEKHSFLSQNIHSFEVPGSLEIPLFALKAIQTQKYAAIIGFGWVVDGGIYRHEFVANTILRGIMDVQLKTGIPVFSCILTPHSFSEQQEHIQFFKNHLILKGQEAAKSCLAFLESLKKL